MFNSCLEGWGDAHFRCVVTLAFIIQAGFGVIPLVRYEI